MLNMREEAYLYKISHPGRRPSHCVRQLGGGDPDLPEDPPMPLGLRVPGESLLTAARSRENSLVVPVRPRVKVGRPLTVDLPPPEEPLGEDSEAAVFWLTGPDRPPILGPASDNRLALVEGNDHRITLTPFVGQGHRRQRGEQGVAGGLAPRHQVIEEEDICPGTEPGAQISVRVSPVAISRPGRRERLLIVLLQHPDTGLVQLNTRVAVIKALEGPVLEGLTPLLDVGNHQVLKDALDKLSARVIVPVT